MTTTFSKRRGLIALSMLLCGAAVTSCSFDVTNPGPVQDEFLNDTLAFQAVVNGMGRDLSEGLNFLAFHGAMVTRELFPTGGTGQFGISPNNADGVLDPDEQGAPWNLTQRARWVAEDGIRRMTSAQGGSPSLLAQAYLWGGYSSRALGENMCEAVIDGGPIEPRNTLLQRAETHFSMAIEVAGASGAAEVAMAARAGRASVRVHLGDWTGAVADAAGVPTDFVYEMPYFNRGDQAEFNRIAYASFAEPYKTHTVWGTVYEDEYLNTGDPRVSWTDTGVNGDGAVACCGPVPFYRQGKYPLRESPITLSSGVEMRLIEAEDQLVKGNWQAAMNAINTVRGSYGVAPRTAADATVAWTHLKRERGIQLWLEGRRLGDLYRWNASSTPGALDPKETVSGESYLRAQDLCFPIPRTERETNPNIS